MHGLLSLIALAALVSVASAVCAAPVAPVCASPCAYSVVPKSVVVVKKRGSRILGNKVVNCVGDINRIRLSPCYCPENFDCITQAFGTPNVGYVNPCLCQY